LLDQPGFSAFLRWLLRPGSPSMPPRRLNIGCARRQIIVQIKRNLCPAKPAPRACGYRILQKERDIDQVDTSSQAGRLLLSGASGMLGTALRGAMASQGGTALQLVRRTPEAPNQFQWDPRSRPELPHPEVFEDLTAAIHLSGANLAGHRWNDAYKREIVESRVTTTRALATSLANLSRPPKMLLVASAVGIYGDRGDELLDETTSPGKGFLAEICQQWEAAAHSAVAAGIRVVHLRFGVVLNPSEGALAKLLPAFRLGLGAKLGSGKQYMSWISLADAVAAVMFLLQKEDANGAYNFTAPNPVMNAQFTRLLAAQLHRPAFLTMPPFAARLAFGEMADQTLLASTRAYPARLAAAGYQFEHPSLVHALPALLLPVAKLQR
jgi:uncharacterized protein